MEKLRFTGVRVMYRIRDLSQCLSNLPNPSSSLLASAENTMSYMMANATVTPSTGDAMVQTEWRSPTGSAFLVAVKL